MTSVYKPVTLITGIIPIAAGMIAIGSILDNGVANHGYRDFKVLRCSSSRSSRRYLDRGSELCNDNEWPSVKV